MFGLTTKIHGFVLTRDSWLFWWGKLVGFAALVTTGAIDPAALGLTDKQKHIVMGICAAIATISAQFATSALPGKADAEKVSLPTKEQP
jgi:hypothetical protein